MLTNPIRKILNFNGRELGISLLLASLAAVFSSFTIYLILGAVLVYCLYIYSDKIAIPFVIVSYLILVSDINENIRIYINIFNLFLLGYLFLKEYGLDFSKYPVIPKNILLIFILIFSAMILSSIFSKNIYTGFIEVARTIIFAVIMYLLFSFLKQNKDIYKYLNSILFAGLVVSLSLIIEFIRSDKLQYLLETSGFVTIGGYFTNSTAVGGFLTVTLAVTTAFILLNSGENRKNLRYSLYSFFFLQLIALLLTNARASIIAWFISFAVSLYYLKKDVFKKIIISLAAISLIVFLFPQFNMLVDNYFRSNRILENTRYPLWEMAWKMFINHPLLGIGPGMFRNYMYTYLPVPLGSWTELQIYVLQQIAAAPAHNFLLMQASELGLAGLSIAILIIYSFLKTGFSVIKKTFNTDGNNYILAVVLTAAGLGLFARSIFESTGIFTNGWITRDLPFWLIFIILSYLSRNPNIIKN